MAKGYHSKKTSRYFDYDAICQDCKHKWEEHTEPIAANWCSGCLRQYGHNRMNCTFVTRRSYRVITPRVRFADTRYAN